MNLSNPLIKQAQQDSAAANPANAPETAARKRIPLGLPSLKLSVPEIPGYVLYWFRGSPQRIQQALDAGYTFVERGELGLTSEGLANDPEADGNSDLGTRVSRSAGEGADVNSMRLYLMKIRKELWLEDEEAILAEHEKIAAQLRGPVGLTKAGQDASHRYTGGHSKDLFVRKN